MPAHTEHTVGLERPDALVAASHDPDSFGRTLISEILREAARDGSEEANRIVSLRVSIDERESSSDANVPEGSIPHVVVTVHLPGGVDVVIIWPPAILH